MKYLKLFENYNKDDIDYICRKYRIVNYIINIDGSIDADDNVYLSGRNLTKLPLKFNKVNGYFNCSVNNLTSLEGCPERVGGDFNCQNNNIRDFGGFPKSLGGDFYCGGSPVYQVWKLFEDKDKIELFNDYDIIRDNVIIMDRLNDFLMEIGKPTVTSVNGYKCI